MNKKDTVFLRLKTKTIKSDGIDYIVSVNEDFLPKSNKKTWKDSKPYFLNNKK